MNKPIDLPINRWQVVGLVVVAYLSVIYGGYRLNDLYVYLPMARYLQNPALYPGSPLIENLLSLPYPLYRFYGLVYNQSILFLIFLVTRVGFVLALYAAAIRILRDRAGAWLGVLLILFTPSLFGTLGMTAVLLPDPSQQALAVPILVLALAAGAGAKYGWAFLFAGLGFNLHPMLGSAMLAMLTGQVLITSDRGKDHTLLLKTLGYLSLGLLTALPTVAVILLGGRDNLYSSPQMIDILHFSLPFHLFPSAFTPEEYVTTALAVVYLALGLRQSTLSISKPIVLAWVGVIAVFCLVGTLFSEVVPVAFVLKLMPFRSTLFLKIISLFFAASYLRTRLKSGRAMDYIIVALTLLGFLIDFRILIWALGLDLFVTSFPRLLGWIGVCATVSLILLAVLQGLGTAPPSFMAAFVFDFRNPFSLTGLPNSIIACALLLSIFLFDYLLRKRWLERFQFSPRGVVAVMIWPASVAVVMIMTVIIFVDPPPITHRIHILYQSPLEDLEKAAIWAKSNTPTDSLFITPPGIEVSGFTLISERSTLGDFKQAGQSILDPQFASIIYKRLGDLGCHEQWCIDSSYTSFEAANFRSLAARYGACDVLTPATQRVDLKQVYENPSYRVYALCDR